MKKYFQFVVMIYLLPAIINANEFEKCYQMNDKDCINKYLSKNKNTNTSIESDSLYLKLIRAADTYFIQTNQNVCKYIEGPIEVMNDTNSMGQSKINCNDMALVDKICIQDFRNEMNVFLEQDYGVIERIFHIPYRESDIINGSRFAYLKDALGLTRFIQYDNYYMCEPSIFMIKFEKHKYIARLHYYNPAGLGQILIVNYSDMNNIFVKQDLAIIDYE